MMPNLDATQGRLSGILEKGDFGTPIAELTPAALKILEARYFLRNEKGEVVENPRQLFARVARAVAKVEGRWRHGKLSKEETIEHFGRKFFELLSSLRFLPNSPTLMNAGRPRGQLSACFVLPIEDDLGRVFDALRDSALIHKTGGGTGFSFGHIRPVGDIISSSGGAASGPIAFLRIFDTATQTVKQGGTRRGANMAILPIDHPDIEEFVTCKTSGGIENFNLSVAIPDAFMRALRSGKSWDLINPRTRKVIKSVSARVLWKKIAEAAWASGDPGVVFLDRVNEFNPTPSIGPMESTNPCGEQPLLPYESCNLGSLNLLSYVEGDAFNWEELGRDIALSVRFLDDIIEANAYPLLPIEEITLNNRKIGLGVMGWADVLLGWGIPYDSDEAVSLAESTMKRINSLAIKASEDLAVERGPFPEFKRSIWAVRGDKPRRNATVTTVAPTGTISIIAGVSSGIEPVYSLAYEREALDGSQMVFIHPALKRELRRTSVRSRKTIVRLLETGSVAACPEFSPKARRYLKTAMEISPLWHVKMQSVFQKHTENGVSKTINLPKTATVADIKRIYEKAFELGCKGITVFRDTSKDAQVLRSGVKAKAGRRKDLLDAIDWLLDDKKDESLARKRASVGLASISRAQLKRQRH